jgi:Leucine-rich repeat (LRR) protein
MFSYLRNHHLNDICRLRRLRHLYALLGIRITEIPPEIGSLQYLKSLDFSQTSVIQLPSEIGGLKRLKTLDVSYNNCLEELPREIGELENLETLRMKSTRITELPKEIGRVKKLKTLDVSDSKRIKELPREIIVGLHELENLNLTGTGIKELPLEIVELRHLKRLLLKDTKVEKVAREILRRKELKNLELGGIVGALPWEAARLSELEAVPKCIRQAWNNTEVMSKLARETLSFQNTPSGGGGLVVGTKHMHIPRWIREHFNSLNSLDIRICKLREEDLALLGEMPNLQNLTLRFEVVPKEPIAISSGGFPKLDWLNVDSRVPRVAFQQGAMPGLTTLKFFFQFYSGPPYIEPLGIKHLSNLYYISFQYNPDWYRADSPCIRATIDAVRKEAQEHPGKISFYVTGRKTEIFPEFKIERLSQEIHGTSSRGMQECLSR